MFILADGKGGDAKIDQYEITGSTYEPIGEV